MITLDKLSDKLTRLNGLYRIIDKNAFSIPFKLNKVQLSVAHNIHKRNLILKARQLGMSTFSVIYLLDEAIFNSNLSCGIVSYSLEHAQHIFKKIIWHALDELHPDLKNHLNIKQQSAREITFGNGSSMRVDTTLRGGTYQFVLISEFGKTCARSPMKAEEIITGTLNTISADGVAIIESTGEGNEGFFAEMCQAASIRGNDNLSNLDYYLHFFPWFDEESYRLDHEPRYNFEVEQYLIGVEKQCNIKLDKNQKNWYLAQVGLLGDKVKQEYPSTVEEAFLSSSDAYYFAEGIEKAYKENRCLHTNIYDPIAKVNCAFDIGVNDLTVVVFFQIVHGEIRIIDYYEDMNKGVDFYCQFLLNDKKYIYNKIFLPHDSKKRSQTYVDETYEREFRQFFSHTETKILTLPAKDKNLSISHAKLKLDRCVFNVNKVKPLINHMSKYRKKWSETSGRYLDEPFHDEHSNFADAFRYAMEGVSHLETVGNSKDYLKAHKELVESRKAYF